MKKLLIIVSMLIVLLFTVFMFHVAPKVQPPPYMRSPDPYWYGGD